MKEYCGEPLPEVYYHCIEWDTEVSDSQIPSFFQTSNKPTEWSLTKVVKPLATTRNKPTYHATETSAVTDLTGRVLFRHAGKTYDVVTVEDIVVRDFGEDIEQGEDEEGWYEDDDEYNYVY